MATSTKSVANKLSAVAKQASAVVSQANAKGINTTNATNQINKANAMVAQTARQGSKSFSGSSEEKAYNANVITASSLAPTTAINLPPKPIVNGVPDITAINQGLAGGTSGITADAKGTLSVTPTTDPTSTDKYAGLTNLFNQYTQQSQNIPLPSSEDIYNKQYKADKIAQKQQAVNDYTSQLNTIVANRDANVLKVEGQGRGITETIIGGQQAQINKEAAIAALPVQAQLAAAQGNLEMAQSHLETMFKLKSADATAQYNYKTKLLDSVYNFASGIEKSKLDDLKVKEERTYQEKQTFIKAQQAALSNALGQGAPSSVYNAIKNATDLNGVTIAAGIYNGDVLGREAQRANIAQSYASIAASNATRKAAEASLTGALSAEDNAKFNSNPATKTVRDATAYASAVSNYKDAINTYGTGEVFGKGSGALGQAYSALVGATKDYYTLGTLDNGVEKLIALGIPKPSVFGLKSGRIAALDTALDTSKEVIARNISQLNSTTFAGSQELKALASEADKVITPKPTSTLQQDELNQFNSLWGNSGTTSKFSADAFLN